MKTLLISTDFSKQALHAAEYGYSLAQKIKADILLCNAVIIPAETPQGGIVVWPMEEADVLLKDSARELDQLKEHLEGINHIPDFKPTISCINESGVLTGVVNQIASSHDVGLIIIATHNDDGLSTFLLGNHSQNLINDTTKPLLIVPPVAQIGLIKKIAFATDFKHPQDDLEAIYDLIPLARSLNAEILLSHIYDEKNAAPKFQQWVEQFMIELADKANYPHIYYRVVKNSNPENGLNWLCVHGQIDMLAMLHRPHNFFDNLLSRSHTQKMADAISVPLLVFRSGQNQ